MMMYKVAAMVFGVGFLVFAGVWSATHPSLQNGIAEDGLAAVFRSTSSSASMRGLCASRSGCFTFCKNNVGRCTDYCAKNPLHEFCKPLAAAKPQAWKPNAITQPVPEGASKVRLVLPVPLDAMPLEKIGAFGAHRWGHSEGLDHEWISVKKGVPIGSWGDGEVVSVRREPGYGGDGKEYSIVIYYGDGLWGEHMHVKTPLVKEGQRVKAGAPVAYGKDLENTQYHFGEFNLVDQHRRGGVETWYKFIRGGVFVSPFDYLKEDVKKILEEKWSKEILAQMPRMTDYNVMAPTPWEPYLTNPLLFHQFYRGTLVGEWFLRSRPWARDDAPDIVNFFPVQSPYYPKQRVMAVDDEGGPSDLHGTWSVDYETGRIRLETDRGIFYGLFALDESGPRARLTLEYQKDSYPERFSSRALIYTERDNISKAEERYYWEHPEDDMRLRARAEPAKSSPPAPVRTKLAELEREISVLAGDARPIGPGHFARLTGEIDKEAAAGADANKIAGLRQMLARLDPARIPSFAPHIPPTPPASSPPAPRASAEKNCVSNPSPVFTNHITDMSKVNYIVPPPTMGAGPSLKTHSYIGTEGARVPVYAPVDMTLSGGAYYEGGPYGLDFRVSCEVGVRFAHISEPIGEIRAVFPETPAPKNDSRAQEIKREIAFRAGDLIGYTIGTNPGAGNWDFGVYNSVTKNRYAEDPSWSNSTVYTTAVCPFDYFAPDLKAAYAAKFQPTALRGNPPHGEPFCK
jgi:hypothetical protein